MFAVWGMIPFFRDRMNKKAYGRVKLATEDMTLDGEIHGISGHDFCGPLYSDVRK